MLVTTLRTIRLGLIATWLALTAGLVALVAGPNLAPLAERQVYIVRGGSMAPAIPLGAVTIVRHVDPATVAVGDVVTYTSSEGVVVTHRVIAAESGAAPAFRTQGDASEASDPVLVPGEAVVGVVDFYVPAAGFVLAFLDGTVGSMAALGALGGLVLAIWFFDELIVTAGSPRRREAVAEPAH